jgi:hypothetical protein
MIGAEYGFGAVIGRVGKMGIVGKRGHHLSVRQCGAQIASTQIPVFAPVSIIPIVPLVSK